MKIVQVVPELHQGGVERGAVELSRELASRGHESFVISAGGKLAGKLAAEGGKHITMDVCSKNPITAPLRAWGLRGFIKGLKPDIVHARSRVPAWMCWFALKGMKIPLVTTVHGFNSVSAYSKIMTAGERVIYGSSAIRDYVVKNYKFDYDRLRYVPRGVDMDYFDPAKTDEEFIEAFKKQYALEDRYVISIIGRVTEWKGHEDFIHAVARYRKKHPEAVGLIVGRKAGNKGDYFEKLHSMTERLGGKEAFKFAGPQANVREIYAVSDLTVSAASSKPESFGRIAAEAMAMNTPVVGSSHGGTLDIIKDGQTGLLFNPKDADQLAEKIQEAANMNFSGLRDYIDENFSLRIMVDKELEVYRELTKLTVK
ncbi:D-inositol 3-phosphate glycosyltransferase [Sedimentisphaera cyanobacteriorum]|uniref:D-inositol 3-phosphate glycosyltransferase n=1 Tax=Sedimentisphaera cyanobacteriorum TaxID=1940790 RepID=A0A1Q2HPI7_9BACT|nr:glycosyltransferase family 4 protein [Sedimentisphaera cyanobacteriorum]AQQ09290.1 D-inositol 3-phosphate glycosyltransferase [Sedimentisphaera cyanobacteriorum]